MQSELFIQLAYALGIGVLIGLERTLGITIAVVSNSLVKTGIAITSGGWAFGRLVGLSLGVATAVGLAVAVIL